MAVTRNRKVFEQKIQNIMQNKNYITFIIFLVLATLFFYKFKNYAKTVKDEHCFATQISSKIFDFNTFELKVDSMLKITDFKLVHQNSGKTIFEDGKSKKGIKIEYGFCNFELFWKEKNIY